MSNNFTFSKTNVKYMEGTDCLKNFLSLCRKYDSLSADEELELFRKYQKHGDMDARDKLFLHNQRFVYSNAKIYARDSEEVMDYINEGNLGLNEAIEKFNPSLGNKFITFAVWYIRRTMNYYIINTRDIVRKTNAMKLFKKTDKIMQEYFNQHGYDPSLEDVQEILKDKYGIIIDEVSDLYDLKISSIETTVGDDDFTIEESDEFNEKTASQNEYEDDIDKEYSKVIANTFLKIIPKEQRDIIKKIYGIGCDRQYSVIEVANEYNMTLEDMEKLKNKILEYMRQNASELNIAV